MTTLLLTCHLIGFLPSSRARAEDSPRRLAIGVNLLQPLVYGVGSSFLESSLFLPLSLEGHLSLAVPFGLTTTVQYRYHRDGDLELNGLALLLGPRFQITGSHVEGLFAALKLGIGFNAGHDYYLGRYDRLDLLVQPEVGYSIALGALFLSFGVGLQGQFALITDQASSWEWTGLGRMLTSYTPVANLTVGFCL
jgi:hypothetical protein